MTFGGWLTDNPLQFRCNAIQHRALLLHPFRVIVDLAGDAGHDLFVLLTRGVIEAFCDPGIIKAKIARQGRRRLAQIVWRE